MFWGRLRRRVVIDWTDWTSRLTRPGPSDPLRILASQNSPALHLASAHDDCTDGFCSGPTEYEERVERDKRPHYPDVAVSVARREGERAGVEV